MAIPMPSFFKIRLKIIILAIIIFFLLVGLLNHANATECRKTVLIHGTNKSWMGFQFASMNKETGVCTLGTYVTHETTDIISKTLQLWQYYPQNQKWGVIGACESEYIVDNPQADYVFQNEPNIDISAKLVNAGATCQECQAGEEMTDLWGCKPICPSKVRLQPSGACVPYCPYLDGRKPGDLNNPRGLCVEPPCGSGELEQQDGTCKHNCISPSKIDVMTGECYRPVPNCGKCETVSGDTCVAPPNCDAGLHRDWDTCECVDGPDPDCGAGMHWNGVECVPDVVERCPDGTKKDELGNCVEDKKWCPSGWIWNEEKKECEKKTETKPGEEQDPNDPSKADSANLKTIADNTKAISEGINELGKSFSESIGSATKGISNLLNGIGATLTNIGKSLKEMYGKLDGVKDGLKDISDQIKGISQGEYNSPAEKDPYEAPEHNFSDRTEAFLNTVKTSPIFSLPNQLSSSVPGGGSSILTIETGETFGGQHQIDFAALGSALLIIRAIVQIAGMYIAIRIVCIKR